MTDLRLTVFDHTITANRKFRPKLCLPVHKSFVFAVQHPIRLEKADLLCFTEVHLLFATYHLP